ncbi:MAG: tetratricopeptide repeat protein [Bacteroidota bacterium]
MAKKIYTSTQAEQLLRQGKTQEAIDVLLDYLDSDTETAPQLYKELIQLKARYLRAQRQRSLGIITAKREAAILKDLHHDIRIFISWFTGRSPMREKSWWMKIPNSVYVLAVLGVLLLTGLTWQMTRYKVKQKANAHCPTFDEQSEFNILLLPIVEEKSRLSLASQLELQQYLDMYIDSMNLTIDAAWSNLYTQEKRYPTSTATASQVAAACGADMIVWKEGEQMHYQLSGDDTNFEFYTLYPGIGEELLTRPAAIPIPVHGTFAQNQLAEVLSFLLGTAANQIADYSSAAQLLRPPLQDSTNQDVVILKYLQLADSEMEVDNYTKAIDAYDLLIDFYPDAHIFRMNRAVLALQSNRFEQALTDVDDLLDEQSNDLYALYTKGRIFAKMKQLDQAEYYLSQLDSIVHSDSIATYRTFKEEILDKTMSDIAKKKYETQKSLRLNRQKLREDENISGLRNEVLQLMLQLGEDQKALDWIDSVPTFNNNTLEAIEHRLLTLKMTGQEAQLLEWQTWIKGNSKLLEAKVIQVNL